MIISSLDLSVYILNKTRANAKHLAYGRCLAMLLFFPLLIWPPAFLCTQEILLHWGYLKNKKKQENNKLCPSS